MAIVLSFVVPGGAAGAHQAPTDRAPAAPLVDVVVRGTPGSSKDVVRAVRDLGGVVERRLAIIDGAAARVPAASLSELRRAAGVAGVSRDEPVRPLSSTPALGYDATGDMGSLSSITRVVGAQAAWERDITGRGVEVALIDTGVTPVEGLTTAGKIVNGPDLSFDGQDPAFIHRDSYGHGTHLAGIIAGKDSGASSTILRKPCETCTNRSLLSDTTKFVGVAPDASIVNVKVGATDGATDVSQVIAAVEWVVTHARDPGRNIRVINLSYGTDGTQEAVLDPLAHAVEVAWHKGIFVVVSGGNDGTDAVELANPARDPYVLAVGASHPNGSLDRADDFVPEWASRTTTRRNVDVVAPGASVIGLNVPGSFIADEHPGALVGGRFLRGSGTSQSAAVLAGATALLYERFPHASPDQLKHLLRSTAHPLTTQKVDAGKGIVDIGQAITATLPSTTQKWTQSTGTGSIESARGSAHVTDGVQELSGEHDVFGQRWDPAVWAAKASTGGNWSGGLWRTKRFTGDDWVNNLEWATATSGELLWNGSRWSGSRWSNMAWDGSRWSGDGWNGSRWSGSRWSGSRWSSAKWGSDVAR